MKPNFDFGFLHSTKKRSQLPQANHVGVRCQLRYLIPTMYLKIAAVETQYSNLYN